MKRLVLLVMLVARAAYAGGFDVEEQGAVAGGTAGAGTARGGSPEAAWYNPAALADGAGWRVGVGLIAATPSIDANAPDMSWKSNASDVATPPQLDVAWSRGRHAWGVAIGVPFGGGVTWPDEWQGRYEIVSSKLTDIRIAPFFALRLIGLPVRISVGAHVDLARLQLHRKLDFVDSEGDVQLDLSGAGVGVDAAALWTASRRVAIGLSYKSRTYVALNGDANFTVPDAFAEKAPDQGASASVTLPDRIALGVAYAASRRVQVVADADLVLWGTWHDLVIVTANPNTPDVRQHNDWSAAVALRGGVEWQPSPHAGLVVRGGAFVDPSPAPSSTLAASAPDSTRLGVTLGAGLPISKAARVDAFYEYLHLMPRDAMNAETVPAHYSGGASLFGVSLTWTP